MKFVCPGANHRHVRRAARVVVVCLACCHGMAQAAVAQTPALAAELSALPLDALLDMEVTGASKFAQRASDSAASVTVIGAAEIRAFGYRTLADVLRSVRGLNVSNDHSYSYLGVRGFATPGDYNTRVLLLIDGNRVNDPVYSQAYIGAEFPLDVELIERVEFIPGQGSSLYGANALYGVINVITRQRSGDGGQASVQLGSGQSREVHADLNRDLAGGARWEMAVSRQLSQGEPAAAPGLDGRARATDYERRSSLYLRADQGPLAVTLTHADRLKGSPATLDLALDPRNFNRDSHWLLDATLKRSLFDQGELTARAFAGRYRFEGQYVYDDPEVPVNRDQSTGRWWGLEARLLTTRWQHHKTLVGVEFERASRLSQKNHDAGEAGAIYLDDARSRQRAALYAEDRYEMDASWTLTAGARYDAGDAGLRRLSPRVALNYRPRDDLVLKLIHGTAYRQPNVYEAYYVVDSPAGYKANPALRSETVRGSELAAEWRPDATSRLAGSVYVNRARHLLTLDYDPADDRYMFRNARPVRAQGLELEYDRVWQGGARLRGNLTFQRTDDGEDLDIARYTPRRMAKLMAMLPLSDDWLLANVWQAVASRGAAAGYGTLAATLSRYFGHHGTTLSLSVCNLLDKDYDDPGADLLRQPTIRQLGRSWRLRLEMAF
ncbi:MAG TPA: TonB-dependent receptor [Ideonella sp.]|nr:TonB-dependent receptor [Ideonella sp.]